MKIINLILKLLAKFVPFENMEFESLKNDATSWYDRILYPEFGYSDEIKVREFFAKLKAEGKPQNEALSKLKYHCEQWYMRGAFAVLFIYLYHEIHKIMNPKEQPVEKTVH